MNTQNFSGTWSGEIVFGPAYERHTNRRLFFELELIQTGEKISGTAEDIGGFGQSPHPAIFNGRIENGKIEFIKQYLHAHYYQNNEIIIDTSKPGFPITYSGVYNELDNTFSGDWIIKVPIKLFSFIPLGYSDYGNGKWSIKQKEEKKVPVPSEIDGAKVLYYLKIGSNQKHTGNTKSYVKGKLMGAAYGIAICQYTEGEGYYLFDCNENWETINDTFHETIEGAKKQAEFEYENTLNNWIKK